MSSPPAKRQKLDAAVDVFTSSTAEDNTSSVLIVRDLSFQTPLRKKLNLIITATEIQAHSAAKQELSIPLSHIRHVISVAAPDKTAKTWNFVVMYGDNEGLDAWVFGVPETVAKTAVGSSSFNFDPEKFYKPVLIDAFKQLAGIVVVEPSAADFTSPIPLPGRPKETAYHAVSHRGAKEGYLYFLKTGILYGFKKPVQFFPIDTIREVTFTNILQRTFNLVVSTEDNVEGEEFEMIDQALFPGVQEYTVKHKIQDASLSELRKAKKVGKEDRDAESGELEKAVKEYEAEYSDEDEDFRDFDKAEAKWDDGEAQKGKGKGKRKIEARPGKRQPIVPQQLANGNDADTSDDEELDATFEGGVSDDGSPGGTSDEDDSDEDSDSDDSEDGDEDEEDDEGDDDDEEDE